MSPAALHLRVAVALSLVLSCAAKASAAVSPATAPAKDRVVVDAKTEAVIKGALKYLASTQTPAGSWTSPNGAHPVALTGYALMAYLAAGQVPGQGEYGQPVKRGVDYLLTCVQDDGYISSDDVRLGRFPSNMYDHGIATIALGEVYGQTQDPRVAKALNKSITLIVASQNPEGGWRYNPKPTDADISVTVLQVVALRCAKNGGLVVPQATINKAIAYVKSCYDESSGGFVYRTPEKKPGFARTAAAIYSLQVCGLYDDPLVAKGSAYLTKTLATDREWFTYGNFYAAPAQYMIGGETWSNWYSTIRDELLKVALTDPRDSSQTYWVGVDGNARSIGPSYATSVYTMILAMPYHYVPLYQR